MFTFSLERPTSLQIGADLVVELLLLRQHVHRRFRAAAVLDRRQRVALELIDADRGREELQRLERNPSQTIPG